MSFNYDRVKGFTITVFGWFISATILFSLIGIEARQDRKALPDQSLEYTKNFFSAILAASLYIVIAILLGSYTARARSLHLSPVDRRKVECTSIMLRAVTFATIILAGAAIYSTVEGWSLMDALYFTDYTVLTIGIGNIVPKTHLGRSLLFPYATVGTMCLGLLIVSVASFANDIREIKLRQKIEDARIAAHVQGDLEKPSNEIRGKENQLPPSLIRTKFPGWDEVLKLQSIKSDFHRRSRWVGLMFFSAAWFVLWLGSAAVFRQSEKGQDWSYFIALYFTYTSLTTIGYGDYYPTSNFGTVFFIFWSLLALPILTNLVAAIGQVSHRMLVFCSSYVWRHLFRRAHIRQPHWHETVSRPPGEEGTDVTNNPALHPTAAPGGSIRNKSYDRALLMARHVSNSVQTNVAENSSARDELERFRSIKASTQYRLLLAEEIETLVFALRNESLEDREDLCCTWARIIPLLHIGEYDNGVFRERTPFSDFPKPEHVTERLMDPEKALSENNAEYSWMLMLLVEKLCSDLRKELEAY